MLITKRTQALGLELFRNVGIEPTDKKLLVVKSTNHFHAAFGPIAKKVLYVDSDGPLPRDYRKLPYTGCSGRSGRWTPRRRRGSSPADVGAHAAHGEERQHVGGRGHQERGAEQVDGRVLARRTR